MGGKGRTSGMHMTSEVCVDKGLIHWIIHSRKLVGVGHDRAL